MKKFSVTLVIYEYPAANYDILHWVERFKDKISQLLRTKYKNGIEYSISIEMENYNELLYVIPFSRLDTFLEQYGNLKFSKVVVVGRLPLENKKTMKAFNTLCEKQ